MVLSGARPQLEHAVLTGVCLAKFLAVRASLTFVHSVRRKTEIEVHWMDGGSGFDRDLARALENSLDEMFIMLSVV